MVLETLILGNEILQSSSLVNDAKNHSQYLELCEYVMNCEKGCGNCLRDESYNCHYYKYFKKRQNTYGN